MYPDSPYAVPIGSFRVPVKPPTVDPDQNLVCLSVSADWLPLILGALKQLLLQATWAVDTPEELQLAQQRAFDLIYRFSQAGPCTESGPGGVGCESEDCMCCLRWNNGVLQSLVCGVWTDIPGGPTGGVQNPTQPTGDKRPAAGQSYEDCYSLDAAGVLNLPYLVYPGDTLEIISATGSGTDGGHPIWRFANGDQMFGGIDVGFPVLDGTDPLPSVYHMRLLYVIGSTPTFVDAMGGVVTIGGSGAQQALIQVNDSVLSDNHGSYQVCVKVTNNQMAGTFTHTFDFSVSPEGFAVLTSVGITPGTWVGGSGWEPTEVGPASDTYYYNQVYIGRTFASRTFTNMTLDFDYHGGTIVNPAGNRIIVVSVVGTSTILLVNTGLSDGDGQSSVWSGSLAGGSLEIELNACRDSSPCASGSGVIGRLVVSGLGTDPF
jgi:hypothetical protein